MQNAQEPKSTLFSTPVQTAETMTAQVAAHLQRVYAQAIPVGIDLEQIARSAVDGFRDARVKNFVPVLALRDAKEIVAASAA